MCKLFIASAVCCQGEGIRMEGSETRAWMVCTRDVYLPESKCLTGVLGLWFCAQLRKVDELTTATAVAMMPRYLPRFILLKVGCGPCWTVCFMRTRAVGHTALAQH